MQIKDQVLNKILIHENNSIIDAITKLNSISLKDDISRLILFVINSNHKIIGSLTDGDIRRSIMKDKDLNKKVNEICNYNFEKIYSSNEYVDLKSFRKKNILILPVLNKDDSIKTFIDLKKVKAQLPLECVIMAGGRGKRLSPLTDNLPKPMLPLANKPIIEYNIDRLISFGVKKIYITINYLGDIIKNYFKDGSSKGIEIIYIEEEKFLGTAGSLSLINDIKTDSFILMNSDLFTDIDFENMYLSHINEKADLVVASKNYVHDVPYAIFETNSNQIIKFKEKPTYVLKSNAGVYIIKTKLKDLIPNNKYFDITDLINDLLEKKFNLTHNEINGYWIDIGSPNEYKLAKELVKNFKQ